MEQLAKRLKAEAERWNPAEDDGIVNAERPGVREMQDAAQAWAAASLETFRDDLLRKALAISAAIADFTSELSSSS